MANFDVFGTMFGSLENLQWFSWENNLRNFLEPLFLRVYNFWGHLGPKILTTPLIQYLYIGGRFTHKKVLAEVDQNDTFSFGVDFEE